MADHWQLKIQRFSWLTPADSAVMAGLSKTNVRVIQARRDIIREGERADFINLILDGWAIRHKTLADGRRQIIAFLIPGDICDLNMMLFREMDHSISALTPCTVAQLPRDSFYELESRPTIVRALMWDLLVQAAIQREWIVSLGQRSALERVALLICELFLRLKTVELCLDGTCDIPITQNELAEATGITPVHANRVIQELRSRGLIQWQGRQIHVPDMEALKRVAMFSNSYLHLEERPPEAKEFEAGANQPG